VVCIYWSSVNSCPCVYVNVYRLIVFMDYAWFEHEFIICE
jgi:hypothetical protein